MFLCLLRYPYSSEFLIDRWLFTGINFATSEHMLQGYRQHLTLWLKVHMTFNSSLSRFFWAHTCIALASPHPIPCTKKSTSFNSQIFLSKLLKIIILIELRRDSIKGMKATGQKSEQKNERDWRASLQCQHAWMRCGGLQTQGWDVHFAFEDLCLKTRLKHLISELGLCKSC